MKQANGAPRDMVCRGPLLMLDRAGQIELPAIRFRPPFPLVFEMERLRCNACCQVFTAAEPPWAGAEKFDATAVAMIGLLKYGAGMPFNRMERL